tara:strand:+ start:101 stop:460 length:360 start_codon:yes stop_codon:yes gene_type:complete
MSNFYKLHEAIREDLAHTGMKALNQQGDNRTNPTIPADQAQTQTRYGKVNIAGQVDAKLEMFIKTLGATAQNWQYRQRAAVLERVIEALGFKEDPELNKVLQQMRQQVGAGLTTGAPTN